MAVPYAGCGVGVRVGLTHGILKRWLWMGELGVLMAVPDAGCGWEIRGFSWQSQTLVVIWGDSEVLMAVSDAGSGREIWRFLWQSQMLVVLRKSWVFHGCPRRWLWGERQGFHGTPRRWLCLGEAGVLISVPDAGC